MLTKFRRHPGMAAGLFCLFGAATMLAALPLAAAGVEVTTLTSATSGLRRAMTTTRYYSLSARVRPLLFWVGRDNVGEARLGWLSAPGGERGYEMVIGSDPGRAPRRINRWGYITEFEDRTAVHVFGLMTEADEQSLDQAKAATGQIPDGARVFKIIRGTIGAGTATSAVQGVALSDRLTLRDLDSVIAQIPAPGPIRSARVPAGMDPGFLFAMAGLLHDNVEAAQRTGKAPAGTRRSYVYGNKLYDVRTRSSQLMKQITVKGRLFTDVIESEFESRGRADGRSASYRIVYGTRGAFREVPVRVVYRPNWWFEAEIALVDGNAS